MEQFKRRNQQVGGQTPRQIAGVAMVLWGEDSQKAKLRNVFQPQKRQRFERAMSACTENRAKLIERCRWLGDCSEH